VVPTPCSVIIRRLLSTFKFKNANVFGKKNFGFCASAAAVESLMQIDHLKQEERAGHQQQELLLEAE